MAESSPPPATPEAREQLNVISKYEGLRTRLLLSKTYPLEDVFDVTHQFDVTKELAAELVNQPDFQKLDQVITETSEQEKHDFWSADDKRNLDTHDKRMDFWSRNLMHNAKQDNRKNFLQNKIQGLVGTNVDAGTQFSKALYRKFLYDGTSQKTVTDFINTIAGLYQNAIPDQDLEHIGWLARQLYGPKASGEITRQRIILARELATDDGKANLTKRLVKQDGEDKARINDPNQHETVLAQATKDLYQKAINRPLLPTQPQPVARTEPQPAPTTVQPTEPAPTPAPSTPPAPIEPSAEPQNNRDHFLGTFVEIADLVLISHPDEFTDKLKKYLDEGMKARITQHAAENKSPDQIASDTDIDLIRLKHILGMTPISLQDRLYNEWGDKNRRSEYIKKLEKVQEQAAHLLLGLARDTQTRSYVFTYMSTHPDVMDSVINRLDPSHTSFQSPEQLGMMNNIVASLKEFAADPINKGTLKQLYQTHPNLKKFLSGTIKVAPPSLSREITDVMTLMESVDLNESYADLLTIDAGPDYERKRIAFVEAVKQRIQTEAQQLQNSGMLEGTRLADFQSEGLRQFMLDTNLTDSTSSKQRALRTAEIQAHLSAMLADMVVTDTPESTFIVQYLTSHPDMFASMINKLDMQKTDQTWESQQRVLQHMLDFLGKAAANEHGGGALVQRYRNNETFRKVIGHLVKHTQQSDSAYTYLQPFLEKWNLNKNDLRLTPRERLKSLIGRSQEIGRSN